MSERRMFAKTIVLSDAFLDLPLSARCLYFTLGMLADDDGFVNNPKSVMRQAGASIDDLNILLAKRFLLTFESGIIVIKHWRIHNYIQKDRYKASKYVDERASLTIDDNGAYTECIQTVSKMDTQVRLGKDNIYISILPNESDENTSNCINDDADDVAKCSNNRSKSQERDERFEVFWKAYPRRVGKGAAKKAFDKINPDDDLMTVIINAITLQKQSRDWKDIQFIPYPATWLNQGRWDDEVALSETVPTRNFLN